MSEELDDTIRQAATSPQSATVDGNTVTSRNLNELLEADRYLANKRAAKSGGLGLRIQKIIPPGGG